MPQYLVARERVTGIIRRKKAIVLRCNENFTVVQAVSVATCPRNHLMLTLMTIHGSLGARHVGSKVERDFIFHGVLLPLSTGGALICIPLELDGAAV